MHARARHASSFFYSAGRVTFFLDSRLNGIFRAEPIVHDPILVHEFTRPSLSVFFRASKRGRGVSFRAAKDRAERIKRYDGSNDVESLDLAPLTFIDNPSWPRSQWSHPAWQSQLIQSRHVPRDTRESHDDQRVRVRTWQLLAATRRELILLD